ncbi:MFS transporter [Nocardia sp. CDC159]|uniref:MFS transporter n=1 Tax=Nocardia pulmonis TaxID=2951408 RepID=A0A9X2IUI9_9NOCA|nr:MULTISPECIES: MFS transporter [Nocardia]MCM6772148.1 MFS transporter [Nocardia pulmonis]MCM6785194.1 MFS transporter [Nocardia sp. CDC159]
MRYRTKVALVYLLGFFIDLLNMFIASIAYPDIGATFGAEVRELAWIGNAYLLGLTVVIAPSVWLAARFGERRVLVASLLLFVVASLAAGFAPGLAVLVILRFVQGAAGGMLIPVGQAMTYRQYPAAERAGLTAIVMSVALIVPAVSPTVGGLLVDRLSWRWIFWLNVPPAAIALALALWWLRRDEDRGRPAFDVTGFVLGGAAIAALLVGLSEFGAPEGRITGLVLLGGAMVSGVAFVRWSARARTPMLRLDLLREPMLATSMVVYQCVPGIFTGANVIFVVYLQQELSLSATATGLLMLPWAVASGVAIALTRRVFNRVGPRPLFVVGMLLESAGLALLFTIVAPQRAAVAIVAFALMGLGGSLCSSAAQSAAFVDTPADELSHASALWNINRQASFAIGVALMALVFELVSYRWTFAVAATLTLLPLPLALRLRKPRTLQPAQV